MAQRHKLNNINTDFQTAEKLILTGRFVAEVEWFARKHDRTKLNRKDRSTQCCIMFCTGLGWRMCLDSHESLYASASIYFPPFTLCLYVAGSVLWCVEDESSAQSLLLRSTAAGTDDRELPLFFREVTIIRLNHQVKGNLGLDLALNETV